MFMAIACFALGHWMALLSPVISSVPFLFYISLALFPFRLCPQFTPLFEETTICICKNRLFFTSCSGFGSVIVPILSPLFLFSGD